MKVPRPKGELLSLLSEQVGFLETSSRLYDEGNKTEAKRIAVSLRVLLHDTSISHSLLGQLGIKNSIQFQHVCGLDPAAGEPVIFWGVSIANYGSGYELEPTLGPVERETPFDDWWNGRLIVVKAKDASYTRKDIILAVANTDGGAHVGTDIPESYLNLSRDNQFIWQTQDPGMPFPNQPEQPILRTLAYEMLLSLKKYATSSAPPVAP